VKNTKYIIQFYAKSSAAAGELQFQYQNGTTYGSQGGYNTFNIGTDWTLCEYEFTMPNEDDDRIILNFGKVGATYWIDDIKFGAAKNQGEASSRAPRRAKSYYVMKTAEEKKQALTNAMEAWIKGMAEHLDEKGIVPVGYDVINEAIADGSNGVRGLNGVFGGSWTDDDGNTHYDSEPVETEADGLTLNWGSGHWYWGYWVPDYAVKAFQFARQYLPASTKLFYNDYNLESSDSKRAAAIQFVKDIDAANGSAIVDGIGTQMHVSFSPTDNTEDNAEKLAELKAKVDKQFQELAATGKLIRVTELDVSVNTSSPSAAQYKAQSDAYKLIFESYFENVPEAQQSGITIWSLTDAEDEHEYWLKGQVPNLWDASFKRKWAYKGVCDALAGEDVGLTFGSETYKAYYEKNNVSDTVK
jgi:GH35 family endo-1,4-beta-xylanase